MRGPVAAPRSGAAQTGPTRAPAPVHAFRRTTLRRHYRGVVGLAVLFVVVLASLLAPLIAPHDPLDPNIALRLRPPIWEERGVATYLFGTDQLGRDLLARILLGARFSLFVAGAAVTLSALVGVAAGLVSGYFGGLVDQIITRAADVQLAVPALLLAITMLAVLSPSLANLIFVLALSGWVAFCRLVRGRVLYLREREFIEAARAIGCGHGRILLRHLLPNLLPTVIVVATLQLAQFMIAEASLSFLGLGIPLPLPSWGSIINEGRSYIDTAWWIQAFPGIVMIIAVSAIGLTGDWLRNLLDPRAHSRLV